MTPSFRDEYYKLNAIFQCYIKLIDPEDESYFEMYEPFLREIHDFINSQKVLKLDKLMTSGLIDIPDTDDERITFKHKIESISKDCIQLTLGQVSADGKTIGVAKTIAVYFYQKDAQAQ